VENPKLELNKYLAEKQHMEVERQVAKPKVTLMKNMPPPYYNNVSNSAYFYINPSCNLNEVVERIIK
jgi:hypothetical protein